jgi:tetratricopeptide (TPR) repeat protein
MSDSENAKRLFFEALAFIDSSNFQDAEQRLREALQLAPENAFILTNLSVVLAQQSQRIHAREYAEKAISINPDNIEALLVLVDCYTQMGATLKRSLPMTRLFFGSQVCAGPQ